MKVLKIAGIVLLGIIAIVVLLGLVAPAEYHAERSILIDAPKELVYTHVRYWRNWQAWSPWAEQDSSMTVTISGVDGEIGSVYHWQGDPDITGLGEMTNTGFTPDTEVLYDLYFMEPMESSSTGYVRLRDAGENKTEVAWGFSGEMAFPWNVMLLFYSMDDMMQKDFDRGLSLLKAKTEAIYLLAD